MDAPLAKGDWLLLNRACRLVDREKIAAWCRDGVVRSMAGIRVLRIRDWDVETDDTIEESQLPLDPADWKSNVLGDPRGPHWESNEATFNFGNSEGIPFGHFRSLLGGTYYHIQVRRADLNALLQRVEPKPPRGRPKGGAYAESDRQIVERMRTALASGDFTSPTAAATHFAEEAKGGGTTDSKAKRLVRLYQESK